jgi:hypothetical protein
MHLCFVDESGSPPKNAKGKVKYFVIAGLIIPEAQWRDIAAAFEELKQKPKYKVRGEIKWRFFGANNADPKNTVKHLDQAKRDEFRADLYSIITRRKSVKIVACVASIKACYKTGYITSADDLYEYTYKPVTERFQYFLQDLSRASGETMHGMMIADQRDKAQDDRLKRHHRKLLFSKAETVSIYENFIEGLFLTESHSSVGIQLADMVAGAIGRYHNSKDAKFYDLIKSSFRSGPGGKISGYGWVKMPTAGWE